MCWKSFFWQSLEESVVFQISGFPVIKTYLVLVYLMDNIYLCKLISLGYNNDLQDKIFVLLNSILKNYRPLLLNAIIYHLSEIYKSTVILLTYSQGLWQEEKRAENMSLFAGSLTDSVGGRGWQRTPRALRATHTLTSTSGSQLWRTGNSDWVYYGRRLGRLAGLASSILFSTANLRHGFVLYFDLIF